MVALPSLRRIFACLFCISIHAAAVFCHQDAPSACKNTVLAQAGDTCASLAAVAGISVTTFLHNNPAVSVCSRLTVGGVYCLDSTDPVPAAPSGGNVPDAPQQGGLVISVDATCGNGVTCAGSKFGDCCSAHGWCGSTTDHCGTGCNPSFGICGLSGAPPASSPASPASPASPSPSPSRILTSGSPPDAPGSGSGPPRTAYTTVIETSTVVSLKLTTSIVMKTQVSTVPTTTTAVAVVTNTVVASVTNTSYATVTNTVVASITSIRTAFTIVTSTAYVTNTATETSTAVSSVYTYVTSTATQTSMSSIYTVITNTVRKTETSQSYVTLTSTEVTTHTKEESVLVTSTVMRTQRVTKTLTETEIDTSIITTITTVTLLMSQTAGPAACSSRTLRDARDYAHAPDAGDAALAPTATAVQTGSESVHSSQPTSVSA